MPAGDRITMQYGTTLAAGTDTPASSVRISPKAGAGRRTLLMIQNTGANPGLVRFGEPILGDGTDLLFTPGSGLLFDRASTCPEGAINLGSNLGTTFAILEQVTPK